MNYQEENAKAEMIGGAIAVGCFLIPVGVILLMLMLVALFG